MSLPESPASLTTRLGDLARRFGLGGRGARQVRERAAALRLPFPAPPLLQPSIWWRAGPQLQRLVELPRGALSGPVQEDKADAHALLVRVVEQQRHEVADLDLKRIDGLAGESNEPPFAHLEDFAATPACRNLRIISYKDFLKTISLALPRFLAGEPIQLLQADWLGERLFWTGEQNHEAFASAIVYARLRGLEDSLPAVVTRYRLSADGLNELRRNHHVLAMPELAWSDPAFMGLLLDSGLPYARLPLLHSSTPEILLLPRRHPEANALGEGLRQAGAADVTAWLRSLLDATPG
ncbi:DUF6685 family protein [Zestomonas carbonaria]|uniref:Uncharacterized protein n=1 Tax=Zestomonas carbonaria TaxID=2762745 RepID=A0A7U7I9X0_9GAMM|nr:DUF6685 family protein [Pseudomonas carbonaria]CAD5108745.1 hypothetical protein PSEWESI4_03037 [Pseudomonas carbonaria]